MDEALDFSVKKRSLTDSAPLKVKEEQRENSSSALGRFASSPMASSSSSQSSQSPTSTSHPNNPMPFSSMFRAMGWDPNMAGPFGLFGNPLTPMPSSPSGIPNFFPQSFGTTPDSSMYPSASLAMSTLQRRRRSAASVGSEDQECGSKKTKSIPEDKKDEAYWERRRKNNEAAKRSRDTRRHKEEEIAVRAAYLEQENLKLRAQVAILKNETAKLHFMLFNHVQPPTA